MKHFLYFLLFWSSLVHSEPITFSFKELSLTTFLKTLYSDILKVSYVISPTLSGSATRVNLEMVFKDREDLQTKLPKLLNSLGVSQVIDGSTYFISSAVISAPSPALLSPLPPSADVQTIQTLNTSNVFQPQKPIASAPPPEPLIWHAYKPSFRSPDYVCSVLSPGSKDTQKGPCSVAGSSVLFQLTQTAFDLLKPALEALDTLGQRVEISTALAEVSLNSSKASGLRVVANILGGSFEFGTPAAVGSALTFKAANFSLVLDALGTDQRIVHVVSPSGVVDSGDKLSLAIGDRQPTLSAVSLNQVGAAQQSIQYQQAGALLTVTPHVFGGDRIRLNIDSEVSTFSPTTTGIQSPTISQRKVTTALTLQSGQVVALGGLRSSKDTDTKHKFFDRWSVGSSSGVQTTDLVLLVYAKVLE